MDNIKKGESDMNTLLDTILTNSGWTVTTETDSNGAVIVIPSK